MASEPVLVLADETELTAELEVELEPVCATAFEIVLSETLAVELELVVSKLVVEFELSEALESVTALETELVDEFEVVFVVALELSSVFETELVVAFAFVVALEAAPEPSVVLELAADDALLALLLLLV